MILSCGQTEGYNKGNIQELWYFHVDNLQATINLKNLNSYDTFMWINCKLLQTKSKHSPLAEGYVFQFPFDFGGYFKNDWDSQIDSP